MLFHFRRLGLSLCAASLGAIALAPPHLSRAVQFPDGRTAFEAAPRLIEMTSVYPAREAETTYYITVHVPETAGESLKALRIQQLPNLETKALRDNSIQAFGGTRFARQASLPVLTIGGPDTPGEISVVLETPVPPGQTMTIGIDPDRNPRSEEIYQYHITAYPDGNGIGLPLGVVRINIDDG